jgi:hypothetical protein
MSLWDCQLYHMTHCIADLLREYIFHPAVVDHLTIGRKIFSVVYLYVSTMGEIEG